MNVEQPANGRMHSFFPTVGVYVENINGYRKYYTFQVYVLPTTVVYDKKKKRNYIFIFSNNGRVCLNPSTTAVPFSGRMTWN